MKASILSPNACNAITEERHLGRSVELQSILQPADKEPDDMQNLYVNTAEIQRNMQGDNVSQNVQPPDVSNNPKPVHTTIINLGSIKRATEPQVKILESQIIPGKSTKFASESSGLLRGNSVDIPSPSSEVDVTNLSSSHSTIKSATNSTSENSNQPKRKSFILPEDFVTRL